MMSNLTHKSWKIFDFTNLFVPLDGNTYATLAEAEEAGAAVLKYGSFISQILDFLIIAFVIFIIVKKLIDCFHFSKALSSRAQIITIATNKEAKGQQA